MDLEFMVNGGLTGFEKIHIMGERKGYMCVFCVKKLTAVLFVDYKEGIRDTSFGNSAFVYATDRVPKDGSATDRVQKGRAGVQGAGVDNTFRRKFDKEEYLQRAREREEKELDRAKSKSKGPPVQRKPLKHRDYEVDLDSRLGKTQVVTPIAPLSQQAGYFCSVCECVVKDSANYLDHINGKKHQRALGMSMRVERASLEQVQQRFENLKKRKETGTFTEQDLDERILKQQQEEEERKRQRRERKKEKKKEKAVEEEIEVDPDVAAMMGFGGFGYGWGSTAEVPPSDIYNTGGACGSLVDLVAEKWWRWKQQLMVMVTVTGGKWQQYQIDAERL
ncbi:zinc finger matrin-type protein 2 [Tanacetum coccineum]